MITYKLKKKFSGEKQNTFNDWETNSSISQVDLAFFFLSHVMIIKSIFGDRTWWDFCNPFERNFRNELAFLHYK